MIRQVLFALAFLVLMVGCANDRSGTIFPQPYIPVEQSSAPNESEVLADLAELHDVEVSKVHSVDAHVYIIESVDGTFFKITYYLLEGEWVFISEHIEL